MDIEITEIREGEERLTTSEEQEKRTEEEQIFDWLLARFVEGISQKNIGAFFKGDYLLPWGGNADYNGQRQLLLALTQILLKDQNCACLRYCVQEKKIQIALANSEDSSFDLLTWRIIQSLTNLENEQPLPAKIITEEQHELLATAICKDKDKTTLRVRSEIIRTLNGKEWEDKRGEKTFRQWWKSSERFTEQWKAAKKNHLLEGRKEREEAVNEALREFLLDYKSYYELLTEIAREKWTKNQELLPQAFLIPLVHLEAVKHLLANMRRKNKDWLELAAAITKGSPEKLFPKENWHAEIKMLRFNDFNAGIFTAESWPAVITKSPCVYCWMTLWVRTNSHEEKVIITEYLGCSGIFYLNWRGLSLPASYREAINNGYRELAQEITNRISSNRKWIDNNRQVLDLTRRRFFGIELEAKKKTMEVAFLQQNLRQYWLPQAKFWIDIKGQEDPLELELVLGLL